LIGVPSDHVESMIGAPSGHVESMIGAPEAILVRQRAFPSPDFSRMTMEYLRPIRH